MDGLELVWGILDNQGRPIFRSRKERKKEKVKIKEKVKFGGREFLDSFLCALSLWVCFLSLLCFFCVIPLFALLLLRVSSLRALSLFSHGLRGLRFKKCAFHHSTMKKKKKQRLASFWALHSNRHRSNEKEEDGEDQVEILEDDQSGKVSSHEEMSFPSFYHEEEEEEAEVCIFSGTRFKPTSI